MQRLPPPSSLPSSPAGPAGPAGPAPGRHDAIVPLAGLEGRLVLRPGSLTSGPKVLLDGAPLKPERGGRIVVDGPTRTHVLRIKPAALGIDPFPRLEIDGDVLDLYPRLSRFAYAWCLAPFTMVFFGGAVGGGLGGLASYFNVFVFRSSLNLATRVVVTAAIASTSVVSYVAIAMWLSSLR